MDFFWRWPESFPIPENTVNTVSRILIVSWTSRFGFNIIPQTTNYASSSHSSSQQVDSESFVDELVYGEFLRIPDELQVPDSPEVEPFLLIQQLSCQIDIRDEPL